MEAEPLELATVRQPFPLDREGFRVVFRGGPKPKEGTQLAPMPDDATRWLGHAKAFAEDSLGYLAKVTREVGPVVRLRFGALVVHVINDPELTREVMHERNRIYGKKTRGFDKLKMILGRGLVTSEGRFWLRQRRIAQPAFHRKRILAFGEGMVRATEERIAGWQANSEIDIAHEMMQLTLRIVGETLLGTDVTGEAADIGEAVSFVIEDVNQRIVDLIDVPLAIPTTRNRKFKRYRATLDRVVFSMIESRRKSGEVTDDLLSMFMEARYEDTGEAMSDQQLRDEVMTVFLAGHETTANALNWTFFLLSQNPDVARRLQAELDEVLGGRSPTIDDLKALVYTEQVIKESMRLLPPVWLNARSPIEDDDLGGYFIPKGSLVFISPYALHHDARLWDDPETFDPDRFEASREQPDRFTYMPFGAGPRRCVGNIFAMVEAKLLLATIAQKVSLELVEGHPVEPEPVVTLRPKHGLKMHVHKRA